MSAYNIIALLAVLISLATIFIMLRGQRHQITASYAEQLVARIETLERELQEAKVHIKALEEQNNILLKEKILLLQKLVGLNT